MHRRVAFLLLLVIGCSKPPEADQLRKAVVSWSSSLAMTAQYWRIGQVPDRFVKTVTEGAVDELGNQSRSSQAIAPALTRAAAGTIALAHELDDAVEHHDRSAAARNEQELDAIARDLRQ